MKRLLKRIFAGFETFDGKEENLYEYRFTEEGYKRLEWLLVNKDKLEKLVEENKCHTQPQKT